MTGRLRALVGEPPVTALGLLWPWLAPWSIRSARGRAENVPAGAAPFRVVAANALGPNRRPAEFASTIAAVETDVLIVVEASATILDALEAAEVARYHQHGLIEARPRWGGCGVWSRHPTELLEVGDAGHAYLAARVHLPAGALTVVAVHTWAPFRFGTGRRWRESFDALSDVCRRIDGPLVAAGDYNATLGHAPLRRFIETTGLRDAHTAAGRGLARSWPQSRFLPAVGLIDRVLVSDDIAVAAIAEQPMPGSDHRAVIANLAVNPSPAGPPG